MTMWSDMLDAGWTMSGDGESPDWTPPPIGSNYFDANLNPIDPNASKFTDDFYGNWEYNDDGGQEYQPKPSVNFNGKQYDVPEYMMGPSVDAATLDNLGIPYTVGPGGKPLVDPSNQTWNQVKDTQRQKNKAGEGLSSMLFMAPLAMVAGPMMASGIGATGSGAVIGGANAAISGGNIAKGAALGALGGTLSSYSPEASAALKSYNIPTSIANAAVKAGTSAVMAGASGGDVQSAIMGSLVGSGVSGATGEYLPENIAKMVAPVISTALLGGDVNSAVLKSGLNYIKGVSSSGGASEPTKDSSEYQYYDDDFDDGYQGDNLTPSSAYEGLGYSANDIEQLESGTYSGSEQSEAEASEQLGDLYDLAYPDPTSSSSYEGLGYSANDIEQLESGTYSGSEQTEAEAREQLGDLYDLAYPDGFPTSSSAYEGLGYSANDINQLINGTYSGSEQSEAEAREQLGDQYDLVYPDGFPTSSSAYEGLGYSANDINQLINGTYSGPEQTEAEVREQMGDELFNLAYPNGYNAAVNGTTSGAGGGAGGTGGGTGGTGGGTTGGTTGGGLASTLKNVNESLFPKDQGSSAVVPMSSLRPTMISTGQPTQSNTPEYSQIIGQLASILGKRGYKVGGSVHVPGPEGRFYEKHETRGFAVGGPGTGQSDDIPTMLSDGEYVFDADTVAALGDGSSKAGANLLNKFREEIRSHKRSAPTDRIPPKAKNPLVYLKSAKKSKG